MKNAGQHLNLRAFMNKYLYLEFFFKNQIFVVLRFFFLPFLDIRGFFHFI